MDIYKKKKILAVASSGGHWIQLLRLRSAFNGHKVVYATVEKAYHSDVKDARRFYTIPDATSWDKVGLILLSFKLFLIILFERPQIVISTGAAPGYFALRLGKLIGARTIWVDSIANAEKMSHTGILVKNYADLWLTQWEHLQKESGPLYRGQVIE